VNTSLQLTITNYQLAMNDQLTMSNAATKSKMLNAKLMANGKSPIANASEGGF
jgi:hypothetical protein